MRVQGSAVLTNNELTLTRLLFVREGNLLRPGVQHGRSGDSGIPPRGFHQLVRSRGEQVDHPHDRWDECCHPPSRREKTLEEGMEVLYNDLDDSSSYDYRIVEHYWEQLLPTVSHSGTMNVANVKQALRVAYRAHRSQMLKPGEPFIIHPVEATLSLSGMKMDAETVMSGLFSVERL